MIEIFSGDSGLGRPDGVEGLERAGGVPVGRPQQLVISDLTFTHLIYFRNIQSLASLILFGINFGKYFHVLMIRPNL